MRGPIISRPYKVPLIFCKPPGKCQRTQVDLRLAEGRFRVDTLWFSFVMPIEKNRRFGLPLRSTDWRLGLFRSVYSSLKGSKRQGCQVLDSRLEQVGAWM